MATPIPSLTNNSRADSGASIGAFSNNLGGLNIPLHISNEKMILLALAAVVVLAVYKKGRK